MVLEKLVTGGLHIGLLLAALIVFGTFLLLIVSHQKQKYWAKLGVPHLKPTPVFGNLFHLILGKTPAQYVTIKEYKDLAPHPFGGVYQFWAPGVLLRDPELIKLVLVKDFDHFADRPGLDPANTKEPYVGKMVTALKGQEWKDLRSVITPTFTSGKMKRMFPLFMDCCSELIKKIDEDTRAGLTIEGKDMFGRLTTDIVGSTAFGFKVNIVNNPDHIFQKMVTKLQSFTRARIIKFILLTIFPKLMWYLGVTFLDQESLNYLVGILKSAIKQRRSENIRREDFLQLMLDAAEGTLQQEDDKNDSMDQYEKDAVLHDVRKIAVTDEVVIAQSLIFLAAGFDTTSHQMMYAVYLLALNPEKQEKLFEHIRSVLDETEDQKMTYDVLQKMEYAEMVFNESMRLYPAGVRVDRICTKDYQIPGEKITIKKGQSVTIPVVGLHYDEKYFPDPEKFIPERFGAENKANISPYVYMPFGNGPRNCIGNRFALLQAKLTIVMLVRNYIIKLSPKMATPFVAEKYNFILKPKGGMLLEFERRSDVLILE